GAVDGDPVNPGLGGGLRLPATPRLEGLDECVLGAVLSGLRGGEDGDQGAEDAGGGRLGKTGEGLPRGGAGGFGQPPLSNAVRYVTVRERLCHGRAPVGRATLGCLAA